MLKKDNNKMSYLPLKFKESSAAKFEIPKSNEINSRDFVLLNYDITFVIIIVSELHHSMFHNEAIMSSVRSKRCFLLSMYVNS